MRVVVYDDESLEPITVLNIPLGERDMLSRRYWRVPVPEPFEVTSRPPEETTMIATRVVDLEFEPFTRQSTRHGLQRGVFCFTRATELAMLLNPAWLPGQRRAIDFLQEQNDRLTSMLMRAFFD